MRLLKISAIVFFGITIIGLGILLLETPSTKGIAQILNRSGNEIREIEIYVCKQRFRFWNLPNKSAIGFFYVIKGESRYTIKVIFTSGKTVQAQVGYVTKGFNFFDNFIVLSDKVRLENRKVLRPPDFKTP